VLDQLDHRHAAADTRRSEQCRPVARGESRQLVTVSGEQRLVGRDERLAPRERGARPVERLLDAAGHLDDRLG
jgi:hypothetical protein